MKLASTLVLAALSLLAASPASAAKMAIKCDSGLPNGDAAVTPTPVAIAASPAMTPAPTPAATQPQVQETSDVDDADEYAAPSESDADEEAAAPADDSIEEDASAAAPAPVSAAYGSDEIGAEYDDDDNNTVDESVEQNDSATPAPADPTQTATQTQPGASQDGVDPATCLDAHNRVRAAVGVDPLVWDPVLASRGVSWAQRMEDRGFFDHNTPGQSDEQMNNLYSGTDCLSAVAAFESEKPLFPADRVVREEGYKEYGHYSMMVWRDTTRVGCGRGATKNVVCYYETPGNIVGQAAY